MNVESRDSVSLKPAELDEFAQLLSGNGLSLTDEQLDLQVEAFPLAVVAMLDSQIQGVMLGSLERYDRDAIVASARERWSYDAIGARWDGIYREILARR